MKHGPLNIHSMDGMTRKRKRQGANEKGDAGNKNKRRSKLPIGTQEQTSRNLSLVWYWYREIRGLFSKYKSRKLARFVTWL